MKTKKTRNCIVFEAPLELTEKARIYADIQMVSTSAICRQALNKFLNEKQRLGEDAKYPTY